MDRSFNYRKADRLAPSFTSGAFVSLPGYGFLVGKVKSKDADKKKALDPVRLSECRRRRRRRDRFRVFFYLTQDVRVRG